MLGCNGTPPLRNFMLQLGLPRFHHNAVNLLTDCRVFFQSPTDLTLNIYTASQLLDKPSLLANMTAYATHQLSPSPVNKLSSAAPRSVLYLDIRAKAGYYTHEKHRMEAPDPVGVEIGMFLSYYPSPPNNESQFSIPSFSTLFPNPYYRLLSRSSSQHSPRFG